MHTNRSAGSRLTYLELEDRDSSGHGNISDSDKSPAFSPFLDTEAHPTLLGKSKPSFVFSPSENTFSQESYPEQPSDKNHGVQSREVPYQSSKTERQLAEKTPWHTGLLERFPWVGAGALIANILLSLVAVFILIFSDNMDIHSWGLYFQPSVWLSITSTLANQCLSLALAQGVVIAFWRKAVKGTTLEDLHRQYEEGSSFFDAIAGIFRGIFHARSMVVALACILSTIASIRSPILQRASTVVSVIDQINGNMTLRAAEVLGDYDDALGYVTGRNHEVSYLSQNFTDIVRNYTNREEIFIDAENCGDKCTTTIKGFGFMPNCSQWDVPFNSTSPSVTDPWSGEIFTVEVSTESSNYLESSALTFNVSYANNGLDGNSTRIHICDLYPGIMEYPVMVADGTTSLRGTWSEDKLNESLILQAPIYTGTVLGGFSFFFDQQFSSSITVYWGGATGWVFQTTGLLATQYTAVNGSSTTPSDPMSDMIEIVRQVAFRTAIQQPRNRPDMDNSTQTVQYTGQQTHTVYRSDYDIMIVALMVNLVGVLAVLPLFYGWWQLGRTMSLSPLEIANMFEAPLLRDVDGNATNDQIIERVGGVRVRYGEELKSLSAPSRLRIFVE